MDWLKGNICTVRRKPCLFNPFCLLQISTSVCLINVNVLMSSYVFFVQSVLIHVGNPYVCSINPIMFTNIICFLVQHIVNHTVLFFVQSILDTEKPHSFKHYIKHYLSWKRYSKLKQSVKHYVKHYLSWNRYSKLNTTFNQYQHRKAKGGFSPNGMTGRST